MKILMITDTHNPKAGGAEKYFFTLKQELQKIPNIEVISLGFGSQNKEGNDFIVLKETSLLYLHQWWRMFFNPVKYLQIRHQIKKINPDIIHLHNIKKYTISLLKAVKNYNVIQTVHDFSLICPTQCNIHKDLQLCSSSFSKKCFWEHQREYNSLTYLALVFYFYRMRKLSRQVIKRFIAPSPFLADYLQRNFFNPVSVILPFKKEKNVQNHSVENNHFLYVGRLNEQKGIRVLIKEFSLACLQNKNLRLTIVGEGNDENYLKQKVKEYGIENNVYFVGWSKEVKKFYLECTAVIFPSIGSESFGLVITETMSYARPVIASNRGTSLWLIDDEKTGLLFDPLKSSDLAQKILKLADNPMLAHQLGDAAFEKLNKFPSNQEMLNQLLEIYRQESA